MNPFAQNPQAVAIKRYLFEMLKDRYRKNERYIDRVALSTVTREDYESLGALLADVYESGFMRAVEQYKENISRLGLKVEVVPEERQKSGKPIFGD